MNPDAGLENTLNSAMKLLQSGRIHESEQLCRKILQQDSSHGDALHVLALSIRAQGDLETAEKTMRRALAQSPANVSVLNNYGLILMDLDNLPGASRKLRKALRINNQYAAAHANLGHTLVRLEKPEEAIAHYQAALEIEPTLVDALVNLALLYRDLNQLAELHDTIGAALQKGLIDPGLDLVQGLIALEEKRVVDAEDFFRSGLKTASHSIPLLGNLGLALARQGKKADALVLYQRALEVEPNNDENLLNFSDAEKYDSPVEARVQIEKALSVQPSNANPHDMLGFSWFMKGCFSKAVESFDTAIRCNPKLSRAVFHKAVALFLSGDLFSAWALYIQWYGDSGLDGSPIGSDKPLSNLKDSNIETRLVWTDQGLGDEILQLGLIADIVNDFSPLIIATRTRLVPLASRSFPGSICVDRDEIQDSDIQTYKITSQFPAYALGPLIRTSFSDFPSREAYLSACPKKVAELRGKYALRSNGKKIVGLSWKSANAEFGRQKSLRLRDYKLILENPNLIFVNLQYGDIDTEFDVLPNEVRSRFIRDYEVDPLVDLDTFAAQIAAMDLVISTSNTTVHMAGALGRPTWTLVPRVGPGWLWYWFDQRTDSPWYPTMRLSRQSKTGDWRFAIAQIEQELQQYCETY